MSSNKNLHLTQEERIIIETGITNNSTKSSIADTLGKDKSPSLRVNTMNL